jgi:hypothetical protein
MTVTHIMSVQSPRRLDFEPLKLLNIDINTDLDPDPGFHSNPEPYPAFKNITDPDPFPCTATTDLKALQGSIMSLHASILSLSEF